MSLYDDLMAEAKKQKGTTRRETGQYGHSAPYEEAAEAYRRASEGRYLGLIADRLAGALQLDFDSTACQLEEAQVWLDVATRLLNALISEAQREYYGDDGD